MKRFPLVVALVCTLPARLAWSDEVVTLSPIVVTAPADSSDGDDGSLDATLGSTSLDTQALSLRRGASTDAGQLLSDVPGLGLSQAGGLSSLPSLHGLADDRLRIQVDGADVTPACPNHMNAPLSYVAPASVDSIQVFGGVSPVSVGGDSIGGTLVLRSAPPDFATPDEKYRIHAEAGSFYRSNGQGYGYNLSASVASRGWSLRYAESSARSDDYVAGGSFKPAAIGREGGPVLAGNVVGSSAFQGATTRALGLAVRRDSHLLRLDLSRQTVDLEGFPNQRMDMTGNDNWLFSLRYTGQFDWGDLEGHLGYQHTRHEMDMGPDRYAYGTGMPMKTKAKTQSAGLKANVLLSEVHLVRAGIELQRYVLFDWWPAVGGVMGPNAFWNIDDGRRYKLGVFAEWEARLTAALRGQVGLRTDTVATDAAAVQGYDNGLAAAWGIDAAAFNARSRARTDHNWDLTGLLDYEPSARQSYQAGVSRKSRAPNLYQRYAWSTNPMAALMNNLVGDGNGYLGNLDLAPEVASTISATGTWHDAARARWRLAATGYYTHVQDYIDAKRCDTGQCSPANASATTGFALLQYANQTARLYGGDLSGSVVLFDHGWAGHLEAIGTGAYVRGKNLSTGDDLYNLMPLHGRLALDYRIGPWSVSPEIQAVTGKNHLSRVRNEIRTEGYWLLNLRSALVWKHVRLDLAVENVLNRLYASPLGGAYVGQGPSMTTAGTAWGVAVPGRGRSVNMALAILY